MRGKLFPNRHFRPGPRIAALVGLALPNGEGSESPYLNSVGARHR